MSFRYPDSQVFSSFVIEHNGSIATIDDLMILSKKAEILYKDDPNNRKGYDSAMLVSYSRMDDIASSQISGGTMLL